MAQRQRMAVERILQDPAVQEVSSFIGVDGTNATLNTGRMQIALKPLDQRSDDAATVIRRLGEQLRALPDIQVFMQPVQDLSIDDRISRTQYQLTLSDPDREQLLEWVPRFEQAMRELPQLADVA